MHSNRDTSTGRLTLCFPIITEPESSSLNVQRHGDWRVVLHIMTRVMKPLKSINRMGFSAATNLRVDNVDECDLYAHAVTWFDFHICQPASLT